MNPFAEIYNRPEIARHFLGTLLLPPEAELLRRIISRRGELAMLDLGVGAGRTSFFFLPFVKSYLGIDIASRMISLCQERFQHFAGEAHRVFRQADASCLDFCSDSSFDIVLFSCNGIDCLDLDRRSACFAEIHRVLRPGGILLFSGHNLQALNRFYGDTSTLEPGRLAAIRQHNHPIDSSSRQDIVLFWDGVYGEEFPQRHAYVTPRAQLDELRRHALANGKVISGEWGNTLAREELDACKEFSLYYWCAKKPKDQSAAMACARRYSATIGSLGFNGKQAATCSRGNSREKVLAFGR